MIQPDVEQELREALVKESWSARAIDSLCRVELLDKGYRGADAQRVLKLDAEKLLSALDRKIENVRRGFEAAMDPEGKLNRLGELREEYIAQINGAFELHDIKARIGVEEMAKGRF